jgi:hypothetical protein
MCECGYVAGVDLDDKVTLPQDMLPQDMGWINSVCV